MKANLMMLVGTIVVALLVTFTPNTTGLAVWLDDNQLAMPLLLLLVYAAIWAMYKGYREIRYYLTHRELI